MTNNPALLLALEKFRDTVLNQRGALAENGMTSDQVNDVLNEFDAALNELAQVEPVAFSRQAIIDAANSLPLLNLDVSDGEIMDSGNRWVTNDILAIVNCVSPQAVSREGWQPIETAPKDKMILLYRPTAHPWGQVAHGRWNDEKYAKKPKPYWEIWFKIGGVTESRDWQPTHWMPLPAAPIADTERDGRL